MPTAFAQEKAAFVQCPSGLVMAEGVARPRVISQVAIEWKTQWGINSGASKRLS